LAWDEALAAVPSVFSQVWIRPSSGEICIDERMRVRD
jgi:hypothetical protein